jgi:alanine racemase
MKNQQHHATWVEVDLSAIENNVRYFVKHSSANVMAVVKANGYGHGAVQSAKAALKAGASWLAVARASEAYELRNAGLECPILLLGQPPTEQLPDLISAGVSLAVWHEDQVKTIAKVKSHRVEQVCLHLKVDTGMSRLGVQPEEVPAIARILEDMPRISFEGIFTHFACADELDSSTTDAQDLRFRRVLNELEQIDLCPPLVHAANSAAALHRTESHFDMLRVGISIYGLHPSSEVMLPTDFHAALSWKTQLSQIKVLPPGRGLSYGHTYVTSRSERIGTLPVGYADGFRRTEGNKVLIGGHLLPIVGRVCMDHCMVQLDPAPDAQVGDEVVIIGQQGEQHLSAEDVAEQWGTINYEVTCGIGARVPRIYS